ncbi:MAG: DUF4349 domain-containing protein [Gemmatimonadota bacterium]|nr:DUF4349 domain-containing protein [Gemmatimonadota bacterium]
MRKHLSSQLSLVLAIAAGLAITACDRSDGALARDSSTPVSFAKGGISARMSGAVASMDAPRAMEAQHSFANDAAAPAPVVIGSPELSRETGSQLPPSSDPAGAMLVRHGQASIEVRNVDDAVARIRQASQQLGGFVANTALRNGRDEQPSASLELRVPTAQFDQMIAGLKAFGKVESVTANAEDVGEEYVDLGARVANARRVEARLVEMLASRTGKLSDVLTVEQELARVRLEIERHDARLRWLERRASLSSFNIALHEPLALIDRTTNGPITEAFAEAWRRLLGVIAWFIAALGVLVPVGVVIGGGVVIVRRLRRARLSGEATIA